MSIKQHMATPREGKIERTEPVARQSFGTCGRTRNSTAGKAALQYVDDYSRGSVGVCVLCFSSADHFFFLLRFWSWHAGSRMSNTAASEHAENDTQTQCTQCNPECTPNQSFIHSFEHSFCSLPNTARLRQSEVWFYLHSCKPPYTAATVQQQLLPTLRKKEGMCQEIRNRWPHRGDVRYAAVRSRNLCDCVPCG